MKNRFIHKNDKFLQIFIINIILTLLSSIYPSAAVDKKVIDHKELDKNNKIKSIEVFYGRFYDGHYAPFQIKSKRWDMCNSMTLCELNKRLYGTLIGIKYIHLIKGIKKHRLYLDNSISLGFQSPKLSNNYYVIENIGGKQRKFIMASIIPTYRYYAPFNLKKANLGIGAGINLALNEIPSELPKRKPLNTQVNFELGYNLLKSPNIDLVFSLEHRCNFFGLIGGELQGRNWYTMSIRKWL